MVMSDTHDTAFPPTQDLARSADVVLHCGDMTMIGGLSNYRAAIKSLSECKAELILVIPGNHDVSLDHKWREENFIEDEDNPDEPSMSHELFKAASESSGVRLLDEGLHNFTLKDGRSFSIFASPYTPAFGGYAFAYEPQSDHWASIPEGVDIVMTHGPPLAPYANYRLDLGHKNEHCGCPNLWKHIKRTKPKMHCFGHIHEGYGASWATWEEDQIDEIFDEAGEGIELEGGF